MTFSKTYASRCFLLGPLLVMALVSLVACGNDDDAVPIEPTTAPVVSSPVALTEDVPLEIRDGAFVSDELRLQKGIPTVLDIVNHDDTPYQLKIEGLVESQPIKASDTTQIEFTTPSGDTFTGQLLDEAGDKVLDDLTVAVETAAGNAP